MKNDLLYVIYTHDRKNVLSLCLETLFGNTNIKPDHVLISDDYSQPELKAALFDFALKNSIDFPINFMSFNKPIYYGRNAEFIQKYIDWIDPKYVVVCESDYIMRKGWLEDGLAVLKAKDYSVGISLYSNPDFFDKEKTEEMFPRIMKEDFNEDPALREYLHKPRLIDTEIGKIKIQGTTNSCGSFILNWQRIKVLKNHFPEIQEKVFDRSCNKQPGGDRRYFSDGIFSHGLSYYYYKYWEMAAQIMTPEAIKEHQENEFPWLDICDYSMAQHVNGNGLNSAGFPEMTTFVGSPHWKDEYMNKNPRE